MHYSEFAKLNLYFLVTNDTDANVRRKVLTHGLSLNPTPAVHLNSRRLEIFVFSSHFALRLFGKILNEHEVQTWDLESSRLGRFAAVGTW